MSERRFGQRVGVGDTNRAYSRGYARAITTSLKKMHRLFVIGNAWREKVRDGMGGARCDRCAFWTRGGEKMMWGICRQRWPHAADLGGAWAERADHQGKADLVTHENFACINFIRVDGAETPPDLGLL
jgi:hypothetical protein